MKTDELVALKILCTHYEVGMEFFSKLNELDLIEVHTREQIDYVHRDKVGDIERMIRLHVELNINHEGIDTVFNLLEKIERLESEVLTMKNRLRRYEDDL